MNEIFEQIEPVQPITAKQLEVLKCVHSFLVENGYYPSQRELSEKVMLSTEGVRVHLEALIKKGYLSRKRGWRNLRFATQGLKHLATLNEMSKKSERG